MRVRHTVSGMDILLVVGDGPVRDALAPMATLLGWEARATARLEEALDWLADAAAVVVTSHDLEVAGPVLQRALEQGVAYVGAMGSRATQDERRDWLTGHGVSGGAQEAVHGPAGLDISADAPPEIALSILAELISVVRGGRGASLRDRGGPIHPDLAPGEADCPTG